MANRANDVLLKSIKARGQKRTEFGYGILTADRYVRTLLERVGLDACYRFASTRQTSFDDVLTKAGRTLVYGNEDMAILDRLNGELPKNTLMVFRHVLTTARKDRDGDILRTGGAKVDPKMLLLWQHVHTIPIGKMLKITEHTSSRLSLESCIVDVNETAHDAAVMIDNGMGRFSHGFRALEFEELKAADGVEDDGTAGGFDIKRFEIMECSLVSVPSNVDADTEEIILSLVEGGKLTSPLMKQFGKVAREGRTTRVPLTVDVRLLVNGKEMGNEPREAEAGQGDDPGTSDEADEDSSEAKATRLDEVKIYMDTALDGSWEQITAALREAVRLYLLAAGISVGEHDYVSVVATFADNAIVCVERGMQMTNSGPHHYRIAWEMRDGKPTFTGEPEEVTLEHTTEVVERAIVAGRKAETVKLHGGGKKRASSLVGSGKVTEPSSWEPPSADAENGYVEKNGIDEFGSWHLGIRPEVDAETKGAYAFIFTSDFKTIDRRGLIAIRSRSAQQGYDDIFNAAGTLLDEIDEEGKSAPLKAEKHGRVLSKANEGKIREALEHVDEALKLVGSLPAKALLRQASRSLNDVLSSLGEADEASYHGRVKMTAMEACIMACEACEKACVECAEDNTEQNCAACEKACLKCADACDAVEMPEAKACAVVCRKCAAECAEGPSDECVELCQQCAEACTACADACREASKRKAVIDGMSIVLSLATPAEREQLAKALDAIKETERRARLAAEYTALTRG